MLKRKLLNIAGAAVITFVAPSLMSAAKVVERIIARVNGEIVTQKQFEQKQQDLRLQLAREYSGAELDAQYKDCLLYTSPSPRDLSTSRMPSSA